MLMRSFTRREKILLVVLVLIMLVGLYFLAVHNPVNGSLERLAQEREELDMKLQVAEIQLGKYNEMKAELEEIFQMPKDQLTVMPPYDNVEDLMMELNNIFGDLEYSLNFSDVVFNEKVAVRAVQFTFEAPNYTTARSTIDRLAHTGYRSLMNTLSISPAQNNSGSGEWSNINTRTSSKRAASSARQVASILSGPQQVAGTITFYESAPGMAAE